ncbi:MAG: hypothetical protein R3336_05825, partial [Phycisphaeraceae bacterium]|nr:hypothetical protein [Phycisphaeraceae bacterium]
MNRWLVMLSGILISVGIQVPVSAQIAPGDALELDVDPVGLGGVVQAGNWAPLRVSFEYDGAEPRSFELVWELDDPDGDRMQMTREVVLSPGRRQSTWLYAPIPSTVDVQDPGWRLRVIDGPTGEQVRDQRLRQGGFMDPGDQLIGLLGSAPIGFNQYRSDLT